MATDILSPISNTHLIGHPEEESLFLNAYNSGSLHHGWLITGDEGIGKATLAYKIARFLLTAEPNRQYTSLNVSPTNPIIGQIIQKSHPDFKVLERDYTETDKKKLIKAINSGDTVDDELKQSLKRSSVIKVDDVRDVVTFLSKKSFNDNWRVVIVDTADDLNTSSANALLKILEEPPLKSILLLLSHNPGKLLPTIRSRCAKLPLSPLKETEVQNLIRRYLPELDEPTVKGIAKISKGSIGRAIKYYQNDALSIYGEIQKICYNKNSTTSSLLNLVDTVSADEDCWNLFCELVCHFMRDTLSETPNKRELYEVYENSLKIIHDTTSINMDKKQSALQIINSLSQI
ncbi:MAG: hypothetical protein IKW39_00720 [Alphaproteobacteria bacterium]|nr:hypothetical protein [Alphaproteobacteria bacterium]